MGPWRVTTTDGRVFDEGTCLWSELPTDIVVSTLTCAGHVFRGFSGYGFQRYALTTPNGDLLSAGLQIICVDDDGGTAMVTDVDMTSGLRESRPTPLAELTYNRELLRVGR